MKKNVLYSIIIAAVLISAAGMTFAQDSYSENDCFAENCSAENHSAENFSGKNFNGSQSTEKLSDAFGNAEDENEMMTDEEDGSVPEEDPEYDLLFADATDEPESDSPQKAVFFKDVPINEESYPREKLQGMNISDDTLKVFSFIEIKAKNEGIDLEELRGTPYVDDDLRAIDGYWIFASKPEMKEQYLEILKEAQFRSGKDGSSDELVLFVEKFYEKYPTKYVDAGIVTFITVENKDKMFSELTKEDREMLGKASEAILNELARKRNEEITSKWGSDNPNVHGDMSEKAALFAGFTAAQAEIIKNNSGEPDYFYSLYDCYHTNYQHYYNPNDLLGTGFGGAPERANHYYSEIGLAETTEEKLVKLAYASHYMGDLSMPLHTSHAVIQTVTYVPELFDVDTISILDYQPPHFAYESDFVGANWTTGYNFSTYISTNDCYDFYDPREDCGYLASFTTQLGDQAWNCGFNITRNSSYVPSYTERLYVWAALSEGQCWLNGLMKLSYGQINGFEDLENVSLQVDLDNFSVRELDISDLRVSLGSGDHAYIFLNGKKLMKFNTSNNGSLYVYDNEGHQLGNITNANGKPSSKNATFDVSLVRLNDSEMLIYIKKYVNGSYVQTYNYTYETNESISLLSANMSGYSSGSDNINFRYAVKYRPTYDINQGSFNNTAGMQYNVSSNPADVFRTLKTFEFRNLRVSMHKNDSAHIYVNGRSSLYFKDTSSGGELYIYDESGDIIEELGCINGNPTYENKTFDVLYTQTNEKMYITLVKYDDGDFEEIYHYSYPIENKISSISADMQGYQSGSNYLGGQYKAYYEDDWTIL